MKSGGLRKLFVVAATVVISVGLTVLVVIAVQKSLLPVLDPQGSIAAQQRNLIVFASLLSLVVVIPVYFLTVWITWRFRAGKTRAKYQPNWDNNRKLEAVWWLIPTILITILSIVTWITSHTLDPYRPLQSDKKPVRVQVVSLQWKWLFIYPEAGIATVNQLTIPTDRPINFELTSDAPMNSFWVPSLGGQIYTMSGMVTKLHLQADRPGEYPGRSANISGEGFADMTFTARAVSEDDYQKWVMSTHANSSLQTLGLEQYKELAKPSRNVAPAAYHLGDKQLFDTIVMKYMPKMTESKPPEKEQSDTMPMNGHEGMNH